VISIFRDLWDRFLLYLPLGVMATLASSTYWLVRSTPTLDRPQAAHAIVHEPDYFMEHFSLKTFDSNGRVRSEVQGDRARHFPDTQWLEIEGIRIRSFDQKGRLTTATARNALTNEDGSEVQLMGDAVVVRESSAGESTGSLPRLEFRGEFLHAFLNTEQVRSHKPVELTRGKDHFTADSMEFDNVEQVLQLHGKVRGVLVP
jgi:lipopolysaccharide export system protein LptC